MKWKGKRHPTKPRWTWNELRNLSFGQSRRLLRYISNVSRPSFGWRYVVYLAITGRSIQITFFPREKISFCCSFARIKSPLFSRHKTDLKNVIIGECPNLDGTDKHWDTTGRCFCLVKIFFLERKWNTLRHYLLLPSVDTNEIAECVLCKQSTNRLIQMSTEDVALGESSPIRTTHIWYRKTATIKTLWAFFILRPLPWRGWCGSKVQWIESFGDLIHAQPINQCASNDQQNHKSRPQSPFNRTKFAIQYYMTCFTGKIFFPTAKSKQYKHT